MALHAAPKPKVKDKQPQSDLVQVLTRIVGKAREGDILISDAARELLKSKIPNLTFVGKFELEVATGDQADTLLTVYEAVLLMPVNLTQVEWEALFDQDPGSRSGGGFQALLVALQDKVKDNHLELTVSDRERIARYAHDYSGGGWQGRLRKIFGRTLGSNLGRESTKR